jgi:hypothetical protein
MDMDILEKQGTTVSPINDPLGAGFDSKFSKCTKREELRRKLKNC